MKKGIKNSKLFILIVACGIGVSACGGGNSNSVDTSPIIKVGTFIDAAVKGLSYSTETQNGTTNENGEFNYIEGEKVTFSIGSLTLGEVPTEEVINVAQLESGEEVAQILQTFDTDTEAGLIDVEGVVIPEVIATALEGALESDQVSLDGALTQENMDAVEAAGEVVFVQDDPVTLAEALDHISENIPEDVGFTTADISGQLFIERESTEDERIATAFYADGTGIEYEAARQADTDTYPVTWALNNRVLTVNYSFNGVTESATMTKVATDNNNHTVLFKDGDQVAEVTKLTTPLPLTLADLDGKILSWTWPEDTNNNDQCTSATLKITGNTGYVKDICDGTRETTNLEIKAHEHLDNVLAIRSTEDDDDFSNDDNSFEVLFALIEGTIDNGTYVAIDSDDINELSVTTVDSELGFENFNDATISDSKWDQAVTEGSSVAVSDGELIATATMQGDDQRAKARIWVKEKPVIEDVFLSFQADFKLISSSGDEGNRNRGQLMVGFDDSTGRTIDVGINFYDTGRTSYWVEEYNDDGSFTFIGSNDITTVTATEAQTLKIIVDKNKIIFSVDGASKTFVLDGVQVANKQVQWLGVGSSAQGEGTSNNVIAIDNIDYSTE